MPEQAAAELHIEKRRAICWNLKRQPSKMEPLRLHRGGSSVLEKEKHTFLRCVIFSSQWNAAEQVCPGSGLLLKEA
ncbi:hypothetical protein [Mailhella massiliensis]|uniref:hypothetical protein n=1 Tax=Mailhella massiliensis TaxID=1903261 RepID=UPI002356B9A9|nr:hypothetical protein [Mailhella massiliensis]